MAIKTRLRFVKENITNFLRCKRFVLYEKAKIF